MKVNLLTGGPLECVPQSIFDMKDQQWCGVDHGAVELIEHQIKPFLSIGDFDSSSQAEREMVGQYSERFLFRPMKDDITDTELALRFLFENYSIDALKIYGATGARLDQLLANLFFALKPRYYDFIEQITIIDRWNEIRFFRPGSHFLQRNPHMEYLAFVPLEKVDGLILPNEKYQLKRTNFSFPFALSSNEFVGNQADFSFETGIVMTIQSCDKKIG